MPSLGGSIFLYNVLKFDYCFEEAIGSLADLCDEFVVLDCGSTDGTVDILHALKEKYSNMILVTDAKWEVSDRYDRLAILANQAKNMLKTDWHIMLQADEVISETSYPYIRQLIADPRGRDTFAVRRFHLFGDFNHVISLTSNRKPSNDAPTRLGRTAVNAVGDAESLLNQNFSADHVDKIVLLHYWFVRDAKSNLERANDIQKWFHGPGCTVDVRVTEMLNSGEFRPFEFIPRSELVPLPISHPARMTEWIKKREGAMSDLMRDGFLKI